MSQLPSPSAFKASEIPDFDSLTPKSAWQWLSCFIGWHIPALSEASKKITTKTLSDLPRRVRKVLFRSDLLPHKVYDIDSFDPECDSVKNHYSFTWALRASAIRDIHCIFRDLKKNRVERYAKGHQLWVPESELRWLKLFKGCRKKIEGQNIQYPIGLRLVTAHPPRIDDDQSRPSKTSFGEMKSICFDGKRAQTNAGYWPLIFGPRVRTGQSGDFVQFDHLQPQLGGMKLPKIELGWIWIETGIWGPRKRVLFRKMCSDESIGILIWPQLPGETSSKTAKPTPRIPVYEGDVVELADNDRILVFVGKPRGVNSAILQIKVAYQWVGSLAGSNIAETKYSYPNPCERYPHCVRRPIYSPLQGDEPEVLEHVYFPITELPDMADRFNEARKGDSSDFFNDSYHQAQQSVLNDLRNGVLPDVVKQFMQNSSPAVAEKLANLSPAIQAVLSHLKSTPEYTVEFPPDTEPSNFHTQDTDEYIVEILDDVEDLPMANVSGSTDASSRTTLSILDTTIATSSHHSPRPGPSCLKRTLTSCNLKRARTNHLNDEAEAHPRDLKRRRSVTVAKEIRSDLNGKGRLIDSTSPISSTSIGILSGGADHLEHDPKTTCLSKRSRLSNASESKSEAESTPRRPKRSHSAMLDDASQSESSSSFPIPSASIESLSKHVDSSNLNYSPDSRKHDSDLRRRSSRLRSSAGSQLCNESEPISSLLVVSQSAEDFHRAIVKESSTTEVDDGESKIDKQATKRRRRSTFGSQMPELPEPVQALKPSPRRSSRSKN